jgi:hypothetical protein
MPQHITPVTEPGDVKILIKRFKINSIYLVMKNGKEGYFRPLIFHIKSVLSLKVGKYKEGIPILLGLENNT